MIGIIGRGGYTREPDLQNSTISKPSGIIIPATADSNWDRAYFCSIETKNEKLFLIETPPTRHKGLTPKQWKRKKAEKKNRQKARRRK